MPKIVNGAVAARVVGHEAVNFSHETNRQRHSSDSLKIMSCITDSQ